MVILRKPGPTDRAMEFVTFGALLEPHPLFTTPRSFRSRFPLLPRPGVLV
jgi:hypothetical protein